MKNGCIICGSMDKLMRYDAINRGGRTALVCKACAKRTNRLSLEGTEDSKPRLKDVKNRLTVTARLADPVAVTAIIRKKGGDVAIVGNSPAKIALPEKTRLNMAIRFANETAPAFSREYGYEPTAYSLTLISGETVKTYTVKADEVASLADWIRDSEDDFCNFVGYPYWSAKKTGTRTK